MGFRYLIHSSIFIPWCRKFDWIHQHIRPEDLEYHPPWRELPLDLECHGGALFGACHFTAQGSWFDMNFMVTGVDSLLLTGQNPGIMPNWFHTCLYCSWRKDRDAWDLAKTWTSYQQLVSRIQRWWIPCHMSSNATSANKDQNVLQDGSCWYLPSLAGRFHQQPSLCRSLL